MLTKKKKDFIAYYIQTNGNATESAKKAGYSQHTAYSQGHRLLKDVEVKQQIEAAFARVAQEYELTEEKIQKNIMKIAKDGKNDSDRLRAWELLGKAVGMFKDTTQQNIAVFSREDIERINNRVHTH